MEVLNIIVLSLVSIAVLFVITKAMGYRQISELGFFDYVVGITIGSIAAEMATNIDIKIWKGILAMAVYGIVGVSISYLSQKSLRVRKFISGEPIILVQRGKIIRRNIKKAKIEINDLLTSARTNGYFNLSDIDYAIMETTGKISFLPVPLKRPLNPQDFNFAPERDGIYTNVILDGAILEGDLNKAGLNRRWLEKELKNQNASIKDILLATVNENKELTIYKK